MAVMEARLCVQVNGSETHNGAKVDGSEGGAAPHELVPDVGWRGWHVNSDKGKAARHKPVANI